MGYLSTCDIIMDDALKYIKKGLNNLTNDEMKDILCVLYSEHLGLNFSIVYEYKMDKSRQFCDLKDEFDMFLVEKGKK